MQSEYEPDPANIDEAPPTNEDSMRPHWDRRLRLPFHQALGQAVAYVPPERSPACGGNDLIERGAAACSEGAADASKRTTACNADKNKGIQPMTVLMIADVPKQTEAGYDGMINLLAEQLRQAPGFIMHAAHRSEDGGWRVIEVWASQEEANRFFASHVAPNLAAGIWPKRRMHKLHSCVRMQ